MTVEYLPYDQRKKDSQYGGLLRRISKKGIISPTRQGVDCWTLLGPTIQFDLRNGFPIINERSIRGFWRKPINELGAMINGARRLEEFDAVGCDWWSQWTTDEKCAKRGLETGDIGPGSYGAAFHDFPMPDGRTFDQWAAVVEQIKRYPTERRHVITPWIPYYTLRTSPDGPKVTIAPCHGWIYFRVLEERLHMEMMQRSCDVPIGGPSNMVQYAAAAIFVGHLTGYPAVEYTHHFMDAHMYTDQLVHVRPMFRRSAKPLATVTLNEKGLAATDIHELSGDLFDLSDYHPHPSIKGIPVAT